MLRILCYSLFALSFASPAAAIVVQEGDHYEFLNPIDDWLMTGGQIDHRRHPRRRGRHACTARSIRNAQWCNHLSRRHVARPYF